MANWVLISSNQYNQDYKGGAQLYEFTLRVPLPDQLGSKKYANDFVTAHIKELEKAGKIPLEVAIWEDATQTLATEYYVRVICSNLVFSTTVLAVIITASIVACFIAAAFMIHKIGAIVEYVGDKSGFALAATPIVIGLGLVALIVFMFKGPDLRTRRKKQIDYIGGQGYDQIETV